MSGDLRNSHPPYRSTATGRPWPGLLLGLLAALFLGLSLLALAGAAGLVAGLRSPTGNVEPAATGQPTALVIVLPQAGTARATPAMPNPTGLAALAAAPLPTVAPAPLPAAGDPALALPPAPTLEPATPELRQQRVIVTYADLFRAVGAESGLDWRLLAALAYRESRLDPVALGRDGDMGLMQILPSTWDEFAPGVAASNPFDPAQNAQVAAAYLLWLQEFVLAQGSNDLRWVIVAYNWGPERVRAHLSRGRGWEEVPPLQRAYVADILYAAFGE